MRPPLPADGPRASRARKGLALAALALAALACRALPDAFVCGDSAQCVHQGAGGTCETDTRRCSYPDDNCASKRRYGAYAGTLAHQCVAVSDGGADAAVDLPPAPPDLKPVVALLALHPAEAQAGDTVTLEGAFPDGSITVVFPGAATAPAARVAGSSQRATVTVPEAATAGPLTVEIGGLSSAPLRFRRLAFVPGLQPFRVRPPQTEAARPSPSLPAPRADHALALVPPYLYVLGGYPLTDTILRAPVHADGTLGRFAPAGTLGAARWGHAAVVLGRWLYVIGGRGPTDALGGVERAAIQSDGTLGPFTPAGALVQPRSHFAVAVVGSRLYLLGGHGPLAHVEYAPVAADGTLGGFTAAAVPSLLQPRRTPAAVVTKSALYVVGGAGPGITTVERFAIQPDGSLGNAADAGLSVGAHHDPAVAVVGSSVYLAGGGACADCDSRAVERAAIAVDGSLSAFSDAGVTLEIARQRAPAALIGSSLVVVGGVSAKATVASTERASIVADGTLGGFSDAGVKLAARRSGHAAVVLGRWLYALGGRGAGGQPVATVERARLRDDGTLDAFQLLAQTPLVEARANPALAVLGDYLYVVGGRDAASPVETIERARIQADGTLDPFEGIAATLSRRRAAAACAVLDGHLYCIGGTDEKGLTNTVERSALQPDLSPAPFAAVGGVSLMRPRADLASVVLGDRVHLFGGDGTGGLHLASVERATFSGGALGAFVLTSPLGGARAEHRAIVSGRWLYVAGGHGDNGLVSAVERAAVAADGTLGLWANATPALEREGAAAVLVDDRVYVLGGAGPTGVTDTVYVAPVR